MNMNVKMALETADARHHNITIDMIVSDPYTAHMVLDNTITAVKVLAAEVRRLQGVAEDLERWRRQSVGN